MAQSKKKKRKVRKDRVAIVIAVPVLILTAGIWGVTTLVKGLSGPAAPKGEVAAQNSTTSSAASSQASTTSSSEKGTAEGAAQGQNLVHAPESLEPFSQYSRDFLEGADANSGSWYAGAVDRNLETGEVTYLWDRSDSVLSTLDEFGAIYRKNPDEKVCYLTFDCGYENGVTPKILDTLKEKGVKGVFFVTGDYLESSPELVQRMLDEGHIVGTHTMHHKNMAKVSEQEFVDEIMENEQLLKSKIPDAPDMVYYRPPEGAVSEQSLALAQAMGLTTTLWSWTQYDYNPDDQPEPAAALEKAKSGLHDGCVYLLHAVSQTNADILPELIDYIQGQGYEIRRIDA